nr:MAG TPA: tail collar fiber protein [Caudoviricetes sp.]
MPFDSNGRYSLPPIYRATTGELVLAEQHNIPLEDIAQALSMCLKSDGSTPAIRNLSMSGFLITDLGDAKNPGDAVSKKLLDAAVPIGEVKAFPIDTPPQGWLLCFGQAVSRTTYAALFSVIGTRFGAGDGGSTFNLPDLRGRVMVGRDDMGGSAANRVTIAGSGVNGGVVGSAGGAQTHTLTVAQMPLHGHPVNDPGHTHLGGANTSSPGVNYPGTGPNPFFGGQSPTGASLTGITVQQTGGGGAHNNMQPSIIMNFIIRTGV